MAFHCNICGEESTLICVRCTKDTCHNHVCDKCHRCSDCCDCEVVLEDHAQGHGYAPEIPAGTRAHEAEARNQTAEAGAVTAAMEAEPEVSEGETEAIEHDTEAIQDGSVELVQLREEGGREVADAVSGVNEELAKAKPGPGQWSILECLEHVAITEERGRTRLETAPKDGAPGIDKEKEARLTEQALDRSVTIQAPEAITPKGRFASLAEALEVFQAQRALTIELVREQSHDLYPRLLRHPLFGELNGVEMAVLIAGHGRRHAAQMRAARAVLEERAPAIDQGN